MGLLARSCLATALALFAAITACGSFGADNGSPSASLDGGGGGGDSNTLTDAPNQDETAVAPDATTPVVPTAPIGCSSVVSNSFETDKKLNELTLDTKRATDFIGWIADGFGATPGALRATVNGPGDGFAFGSSNVPVDFAVVRRVVMDYAMRFGTYRSGYYEPGCVLEAREASGDEVFQIRLERNSEQKPFRADALDTPLVPGVALPVVENAWQHYRTELSLSANETAMLRMTVNGAVVGDASFIVPLSFSPVSLQLRCGMPYSDEIVDDDAAFTADIDDLRLWLCPN